MPLAELTSKIAEKVKVGTALSAIIKFDFGDNGVILYNGKESPPAISNEDIEADCTINVSIDDFEQIMAGDLNPQMAFMMGKLKVDGDMGIAMQLGQILG